MAKFGQEILPKTYANLLTLLHARVKILSQQHEPERKKKKKGEKKGKERDSYPGAIS